MKTMGSSFCEVGVIRDVSRICTGGCTDSGHSHVFVGESVPKFRTGGWKYLNDWRFKAFLGRQVFARGK